MEEKGVELFGCDKARKLITMSEADEEDWKTEYLDYKLSIKVVKDIHQAIQHINTYGSGHTDSIITRNKEAAQMFMNLVDLGNVF